MGRDKRGATGARMALALALLGFLAGLGAMAWMASQWTAQQRQPEVFAGAIPNGADPLVTGASSPPESAAQASPSASLVAQSARVSELEQRLARLSLAAQAASYNANRAEAILTAFAVRRAVDSGHPLGYLEGTLRLRFGEAQPKAVATIINAAAEPVTLSGLRVGLDLISTTPRPVDRDEGWWPGVWRELSGIAVIRRTGEPSPEPEQRLIRARRAVEMGQMDDAIAEIAALSPQPMTQRWLEWARRYNEAHRALDVIEAAAILEPRAAPVPLPAPGPPAGPAPAPPKL